MSNAAVTDAPSFQFVDAATGAFRVTAYDDRALSDEEKAKSPVFNPAWKPFSECAARRGLELRPDPAQRFGQADLNRILDIVNRESPSKTENFDLVSKSPAERAEIVKVRPNQRSAAIFIDCAEEWLGLSAKDVYERIGEPNEYYP